MSSLTVEHAGGEKSGLMSAVLPENNMERKMLRSLRQLQDVTYEFTTDEGLVHQYVVMRGAMFVDTWGLKLFTGEYDYFDEVSDIMVARRGRQVLGGGRLTVSSPENRIQLPMETCGVNLKECFPNLDLDSHTYGAISRLAILPEFRAGPVFPELARRFIERGVEQGVDYAFNMAPVPLARAYRQIMAAFGLGWQATDVDVPDREEFEGIKMVLSVMDLRKLKAERPAAKTGQKAELAE